LIDGTYELFRQHFGQVARHAEAVPYAATIGVVASTLQLVSDGATHLGVASDHVIESWQRHVAGLQDQRRHGSGTARTDPTHGASLVSAVHDVGDGRYEADDALGAAAASPTQTARHPGVDRDARQGPRPSCAVPAGSTTGKGEILDEAA
jgi:hypothetical protein